MPTDLKYTQRDYAAIRAGMIADIPAKTPEWTNQNPGELGVALLELLAGSLDILSYGMDSNAMETFLDTAVARTSVQNILRNIGYEMRRRTTATVTLHFTLSSALASPFTLPNPLICTTTDGKLQFAVVDDVTIAAGITEFDVTAYEGIYHHDGPLSSDGADQQNIQLSYGDVAENLLRVYVNSVLWTEEKTIDPFPTTISTIYTTKEDGDGFTTVGFDKYRGSVPAAAATLDFIYMSSSGADGNIGAGLITTLLTNPGLPGGRTMTVTNPLASGGGAERETVGEAKVNGPRTLRTLQRAVTVQDFIDLLLLQPGVDAAVATNHSGFVELYVRLLYNAGWPVFKLEPLTISALTQSTTGGSIGPNQTLYVSSTVVDANGESNNVAINPSNGAPYTTVGTIVIPNDGLSTHKVTVTLVSGLVDTHLLATSVNVYIGTSPTTMKLYATVAMASIYNIAYDITSIPGSGPTPPLTNQTGLHNPQTGRSYYSDLYDFLTARRLLCTSFELYGAQQITQAVSVNILVADNFKQADVKTAVSNAVTAFFNAWPLGQTLFLSELASYVLTNVPGVENIVVTTPATDVGISSSQFLVVGTITVSAVGGIV